MVHALPAEQAAPPIRAVCAARAISEAPGVDVAQEGEQAFM
jgi:hypothetical protein